MGYKIRRGKLRRTDEKKFEDGNALGESIIKLCKQEKSFDVIVQALVEALVVLAGRTHDPAAALDVAQEAFDISAEYAEKHFKEMKRGIADR